MLLNLSKPIDNLKCLYFKKKRFRETIGRKIVKSLKREDDGLTYASIEFLNSLMQVRITKQLNYGNIDFDLL